MNKTASQVLEEQMVARMAEEMAREIDQEILDDIMTSVLTKEGWVNTNINPAFGSVVIVKTEDWYSRTAEWVHLNARGDYKLLKGNWLFKDPKDATMFILRWS